MADLLPRDYTHIVYLDGDTQIVGDATALFRLDVPEGRIAACVENHVLDGEDLPEWKRRYLARLGLDGPERYFNSGVMAFRRSTWDRLGPSALDVFRRDSAACLHHDQSALNAVCGGEWLALSPAWNFQTFFLPLDVEAATPPRIVHFSSSPKPWASTASLWPARCAEPYRETLRRHPVLADGFEVVAPRAGPAAALRAGLRRLRRAVRARTRDAARRRRFLEYCARTGFVA